MSDQQNPRPRNLGVVHLIFGLVFTGIAAIWIIGAANDSSTSELAAGFPAVLIGAGVLGLVAVLVNQRRARAEQVATAVEPRTPGESDASPAPENDPTPTKDF